MNLMPIPIPLKHFATLQQPEEGEIIGFEVGYDGMPYALASVKRRPVDLSTPQDYAIYRISESGGQRMVRMLQQPWMSLFQPLPDGRYLIANPGSTFRDGMQEQNGRIFSSNGELCHQIFLGDGIEDLRVGTDGLIWTSYFDEGVFGTSEGVDSPSGHGLGAWTADGRIAYRYEPTGNLDSIDDCYALNVIGTTAYICYYSQFPLVEIKNGQITRHWACPVHGASSFAINQTHALFRGSYYAGGPRNDLTLVSLEAPDAVSVALFRPCEASGNVIECDMVAASGTHFYFLRGLDVFHTSVEQAMDLVAVW